MRQVILVVIECLRADHVHSYGYRRATTPSMDALVLDKRGIMWSDCRSNASETAGTFAHINNTARRMMEEGGPRCRALFTANAHGIGPLRRGREVWPHLVQINNGAPEQDRNPLARRITRSALMRLPKDRDFFAVLHYSETHEPYRAHGCHEQFMGDEQFRADEQRHGRKRAEILARYDGAIYFLDSHVWSIAEAFPGAEIFVTGDHGEGLWTRNDIRGHGYGLFDELTHVPLIARSNEPMNIKHRVVNDHVEHLDLDGTILSRFGLDVARQLVWPVTEDETVKKRLEGLGYLGREE